MPAVGSSQYRWPAGTSHIRTNTITREGVGDTVQVWGERSTGKDRVYILYLIRSRGVYLFEGVIEPR